MACLPESGGCERVRTDPFVHFLNRTEGKNFTHDECLDVAHQNSPQPSPQPEASYVDTESSERLVIERKSLVWPPDYAKKHKNDHHVAEAISRGLRTLSNGKAFAIQLPPGLDGTRPELDTFAQHVVITVQSQFSTVQAGKVVRGQHAGWSWLFFAEDPALRMEFGEPEDGVIARWQVPANDDLIIQPPTELSSELSRLLKSCARKFQQYLQARRVLIIDPQGDIQHLGESWLARLLESVSLPVEIGEIWTGSYEWVTDIVQDWVFEKVSRPSVP